VTEADWGTSADPAAMLTLAAPRVSDRKLRLYLVGCCRRRWELFADDRCRRAVEIAERYADGRATEASRAYAVSLARKAYNAVQPGHARAVASATWGTCDATDALRRERPRPEGPFSSSPWAAEVPVQLAEGYAFLMRHTAGGGPTRAGVVLVAELAAQADLLRCVFGDPFVYTVPDPAWRTAAAAGLAAAIYAERAFDRLPILADALEEAGFADTETLAFLRGDPAVARGCWVIDAVLHAAAPEFRAAPR
jgi:hypothetical protein